MRKTIGYHIVITGYGLWLPGDERGHWSEAWDEKIGLIEPRTLHAGDAVRQRMAAERMKHPPTRLSPPMCDIVADTVSACAQQSDWDVAAISVEPTHTHLLLGYTQRDIDNTVKWIKDQCTKAIHRGTNHAGPVWCRGKWRGFIFDDTVWCNTMRYIERHNIRRGRGFVDGPQMRHRVADQRFIRQRARFRTLAKLTHAR